LHNAAFFRQYFTKAIERAARQGRRIGVLLVDLEELRTVKEAHGRDAADTMLRELAVRLNGAVRKSDLVARLGADEFAVLAEDILREDDLRALADKIGNALGRTFVAGKVSIQVAIRIRTAAFPAESAARTHAQTDLLAATDFAIYRPETPVGAYGTAQADATRWGDREHQQRVRHRLAETVRLQPFHLHYQPRYRAQTQGLEALEGLMRWDDAELGPVPPSAFIPICERNGMISLLGRVAVERASEDWRRHLDRVATDLPLKVSLNLSPAQLLDDEFLMCLVNEAEARSSLRGRLQVEISDKAGVQNSKRCVRALEELVSVGIAVAIDDFGAGSTSVAQLTSMPVSGVILDAALTDGIAPDTSQARRVGALISMANALGIAVTAKCIETAAQLQCLIALGCHHAQGNALSSPLAPDELAYVLRGAGTTAS
jgi:diguanylate cyclase (GGDEF)-like protein